MVSRRQPLRIVAHQVWHDDANSALLVVEHDWCAARFAGAKLEGSIGIFCIEGLALQLFGLVDFHIAMIEEDDMRCILPGHALTDRAMASVIVDGVFVRVRVNVIAPSSVFV